VPFNGSSENLLLATLPAADFAILHGHFRGAVLSSQTVLYEPGDRVTHAYFPYTGAVSLVVRLNDTRMIETATVGKDGMLGGFPALDGQSALSRAVVQIEGGAWTIDMEQLRQIAKQREAIQSMLLRHERALFIQTQQVAACNASHTLEARLCRWLLRARDACGKRTISTTQEAIAELLGVKRTSVSLIAHGMQQAGLIRNRRGQIELLNVDALHDNACECYAVVATQYRFQSGHETLHNEAKIA
jgi:CRP-like cAMP-binding protein